MTITEVAKELEISVKTFRRIIQEKQIPYIDAGRGKGRGMRFDLDEVRQHLKRIPEPKQNVVEFSPSKRVKGEKSRFAEAVGV